MNNVAFALIKGANWLTKVWQAAHALINRNVIFCLVFVFNVNGVLVSANVTKSFAKDKNSNRANVKVPAL